MNRKEKKYPIIPIVILGDIPEFNIPELKLLFIRGEGQHFMKIVNSSKDAEEILRDIYPKGEIELQEQFVILYMNRKNKIIGYYRHSKGGITGTLVDVRLVMAVAVKSAAVGMIISHNHPSGDARPSPEDINLTKKIKEACRYFDITVLDHVIIARDEYYSFADEGNLSGFLNSNTVSSPKKLYDTIDKRIKAVKEKGNIITFKEPFRWKGESYTQILVTGFRKQQGSVKITGTNRDSNWYNSMDDLLNAIDWEKMEDWHSGDDFLGSTNGGNSNDNLLPQNAIQFKSELKKRIRQNTSKNANESKRENKTALEKLAAGFKIFDKTEVKELIELTLVELAREFAREEGLSIKEKYDKIVALYERQVNLSHRTSQSILLQQYSTPAPIGFLAGIFCGIDTFDKEGKIGFEPSAGNGLLTIAAKPDTFYVNEIDKTRNLHLQTQGFKQVFRIDATNQFSKTIDKSFDKKFDAVITNPPFGRADIIKEFDGYPISTLEHLMAIRTLETMKDNGRAAIIIGNHTIYDEKGRVQKGAQRIFLNYLYNHYNVIDIIPIDGRKLYSRQGTSFDVRLILIDGRKEKAEGAAPTLEQNLNKLHKKPIYKYDGKEYSENELIEFARASSTYDEWDNEANPITTIEDALLFLSDVEVINKTKPSLSRNGFQTEPSVKTFDELYERVMDAKFFTKESISENAENKNYSINKEMKINPEIALAFQKYWHFKAKHADNIPIVSVNEAYYSFNVDAFTLYDVLGLALHSFEYNKTAEPYVKFPIQDLDAFLNKLMRAGKKVAIIDEVQKPGDRTKKAINLIDPNDPFGDAMDELNRDIQKMKGENNVNSEKDELGAPYMPASDSCVVLNTVVPDSMDYETRQALELIEKEVGGDIDEFVRQRLQYPSKLDLCKSLSAEQTDAVAMAIYNIEAREQGMIIGDQTGIGKGRVAAAMIRYAVLQGHKPIFITEKPNLFSDIYRDLIAIGSGHLVPFIVNGRESKTDIKDENGEILHQALAPAEQQKYFKERRIPGNCDFVVATYTQFNSPDKKPEKPQFLLEISKGNIMIMDESHNASGSSQTGEFLQGVVFNTKGVVFLSATFAKRPDNMPLYAMKTAISDANMTKDDLVFAINKGGVALQEVLASELVKEGQMLRRERSFEGVEVNYITLDELENEHKAIADNITEILREIIGFQDKHVESMVDELDDIAVAQGKEMNIREGTSQAGVDNLPYFSKVFQVINQMLFAIKAEAVADRAIERLREGKKPVIAFASTMGSFIEQMENEKGLPVSDGDTINADFSEVLMRGLDGILRYTETDVDGEKVYKKFDLTEFSNEAREQYLNLAAKIKKMASGLSISPIDLIAQKIKAAGFKVAEVTGRKYEVQLNTKTNKGIVQSRNKVNTNDAFRQFNNNEIDVLMINQSGSTGASAHAIVTKKVSAEEVKQRVMIVLQAELNINTEVQKRGRINRTGQILSPIYDYVMSAIPAEKRLMMMLQKKLKSLDANTTSNQKQSTKILDVSDFLNKYGDKIVTQYLADNPDINKLLGDPLGLADTSNEKGEVMEDAAHKVSGRVAVLATKMQAEFYNEISQNYNEYVDYLKQIGEYDLEVEAMNLEAETIHARVIKMGKGGDSEFGTDSFLETVKANVLRKPFKRTELENILREELKTDTPENIQKILVRDYELFAEQQLENDLKSNEDFYDEEIKNIPNEKKLLKIKEKDGMEAFHREVRKRETELNEARILQSNKLQTQAKNRKQYLMSVFKFFHTGRNISYPVATFSEGDIKVMGIFIGFIIDKKKKNPYAPSNIRLRFALASSHKYIAMPVSYTTEINSIIGASHGMEVNDMEDNLQNWESEIKTSEVSRSTRFIITGNLLQAFANFKGKLVSYTTIDKQVKKGILMPEYWEAGESKEESVSVPIQKALKVIQSLSHGDKVTTENGTSIFSVREDYKIIVPSSKQKGGDVFLDRDILELVENNNFEKQSSTMVAQLSKENLEDFLKILQTKFNDSLTVNEYQLKFITKKSEQVSSRKKIILMSPEEVEKQQALMIEMEFAMAELELDIEMMQMRKNKLAA